MNTRDASRFGGAPERAELQAFLTGLREALVRGAGLVLDRQEVAGREVFVCLYPDAAVTPTTFAAWAHARKVQLGPASRFLTRSEVEQAAERFGVTRETGADAARRP